MNEQNEREKRPKVNENTFEPSFSIGTSLL